jgi:hypothetical protein
MLGVELAAHVLGLQISALVGWGAWDSGMRRDSTGVGTVQSHPTARIAAPCKLLALSHFLHLHKDRGMRQSWEMLI